MRREKDQHTSSNELEEPGGKLRLFVEAPLGAGSAFALTEAQAHYLLHVMRARTGAMVRVFNGRDGEWQARIAETGKGRCTLQCDKQTEAQSEVPDLSLAFAPIKKTPADYVSQKATELGVRLLQPVITRRTVVRRVNVERLRANAVEAAEQSGRLTVPEAREPVSLETLLEHWPSNRRLVFCDEGGDAEPIAQSFSKQSRGGSWGVLTGPEGGFDPAERALIRAHPQVIPVTLGPRIMRADTAALAALAVWQGILGDWH